MRSGCSNSSRDGMEIAPNKVGLETRPTPPTWKLAPSYPSDALKGSYHANC